MIKAAIHKLSKLEEMSKSRKGEYHFIIYNPGENPKEVWKNYVKENPIGPNDYIFEMFIGGQKPSPEIDDW